MSYDFMPSSKLSTPGTTEREETWYNQSGMSLGKIPTGEGL
jgi:hypothetical protein